MSSPLTSRQVEWINTLKTGDVVFFHTIGVLVSMFFQQVQPSRFNHCGIVLRDPTWLQSNLTGLYFLDSNDNLNVPDAMPQPDGGRFGVHIRPLLPVFESLTSMSEVHVRKCTVTISTNQLQSIITPEIRDATYDFNPLHWLAAKSWIVQSDYMWPIPWSVYALPINRCTDAFTCSALIAYIFTQLGYLPSNLPWSIVSPKLLSGETKELPWVTPVLGASQHWITR